VSSVCRSVRPLCKGPIDNRTPTFSLGGVGWREGCCACVVVGGATPQRLDRTQRPQPPPPLCAHAACCTACVAAPFWISLFVRVCVCVCVFMCAGVPLIWLHAVAAAGAVAITSPCCCLAPLIPCHDAAPSFNFTSPAHSRYTRTHS